MQYESIYIMSRGVYTDRKTKEMTITNYLGVGQKGCKVEKAHLGASGDLAMLCLVTKS